MVIHLFVSLSVCSSNSSSRNFPSAYLGEGSKFLKSCKIHTGAQAAVEPGAERRCVYGGEVPDCPIPSPICTVGFCIQFTASQLVCSTTKYDMLSLVDHYYNGKWRWCMMHGGGFSGSGTGNERGGRDWENWDLDRGSWEVSRVSRD